MIVLQQPASEIGLTRKIVAGWKQKRKQKE
jgi:hypothetical protein